MVLVFAPGQAEIEEVLAAMAAHPVLGDPGAFLPLALHGALPAAEQVCARLGQHCSQQTWGQHCYKYGSMCRCLDTGYLDNHAS